MIKLLWLAIRDIEDKRARARAKEKGLPADTSAKPPAGSSKAPSSKAGKPALGALALTYPDRLAPYLI